MGWIGRCLLTGLVCIPVGERCQPQTDDVARLRPANGFEAGVIKDGLCGSLTFRTLVSALQNSDLIVYIATRQLRDRHVTGSLEFLGSTATHRILRVVSGFPLDRVSRVAVLGHELQHALEVASAPQIRSARAFAEYFRSHGLPGAVDSVYDTDAARQTEIRIRHEMASRRTACGTRPERS
jgi:hypothetical protein